MFRNIIDLPLSKFIECLVHNRYEVLIISGNPTHDELQDAWQEISLQYADAMGGEDQKLYFNKLREYGLQSSNYKLLIVSLDILQKTRDQVVVDKVNEVLGTDYQFPEDDPDRYYKDLKSAFNRSKSEKITMDLLSLTVNEMAKGFQEKGSKITESLFRSVLITLSDHAGYAITISISTYEYCERVRRYNKHVEQLKDKKHARVK